MPLLPARPLLPVGSSRAHNRVPPSRAAMKITGFTRVYPILGDPIQQMRAPDLFNRAFAELGIDAVAVPMQVPADGLAATLEAIRLGQNLIGCGLTVPHKESSELMDLLGEQARLVGAVNTVRREPDGRLFGEMIDGTGFVASLRAAGHEPKGRRTLLVGAGGTARALAFALASEQVSSLRIANRSPARAEALGADIQAAFPALDVSVGPADPAGAELIVQTTTLGMRADDPLPFDVDRVEADALVADVVIGSDATGTPLIAAVDARGIATHRGIRMLEAQMPMALELLGLRPPPSSATR